jgi:energy-coupling factor transporter ATP-binding protein EcfA2
LQRYHHQKSISYLLVTHDITLAARYRTRVVISWAGSRYRAGTISWARPRYRGISRYRAPAQDNARSRKVLCRGSSKG